jgi:hypothetical protein
MISEQAAKARSAVMAMLQHVSKDAFKAEQLRIAQELTRIEREALKYERISRRRSRKPIKKEYAWRRDDVVTSTHKGVATMAGVPVYVGTTTARS